MSQLSPEKLSSVLVSEAASCPWGVATVTWFTRHPPTGEGAAAQGARATPPWGAQPCSPAADLVPGSPAVPCRGRLAPQFWAVHTQPSQLTSQVLSVPAPRTPREASSRGLPSTTKMATLRGLQSESPPRPGEPARPRPVLAHGERPRAWWGGREGSREGLQPELESMGRGWGDSGSKGSRAGEGRQWPHLLPGPTPRQAPGFQERGPVLPCVSQAQPTGT